MRVLGEESDGSTAFAATLGHGQSPEAAAFAAGFVAERPVAAVRANDGELELRVLVRPRGATPAPNQPPRGRDAGLTLAPGEVATHRQRVAAYAVVRSDRGLLATQYSARTAVDGRWGMPGGGIDPGEAPVDAVLREVHEETAQSVVLGDLYTVQSSHWLGRSPGGRVEDFHAVRLVYRADCPAPTDPRVLDSEGTTSAARWVNLAGWASLGWTVGWRQILTELLA